MARRTTRGLRGSTLEEMINISNDIYREKNLAVIQKIPTPITPMEMDRDRHITLAYFDKKSTVDYMGVIQGIPICFDAKECATDTFPLSNIHEHQIAFMSDFQKQSGIAFFILRYTHKDENYLFPFEVIEQYWNRMMQGGRRSFTYEEIDKRYKIESNRNILIDYLSSFSKYIDDVES